MDARIGKLNSGKFYAFIGGYDMANYVEGTLEDVQAALEGREYVPANEVDKIEYIPSGEAVEPTFYFRLVFSDGEVSRVENITGRNKTEARANIAQWNKDCLPRCERRGYRIQWCDMYGNVL